MTTVLTLWLVSTVTLTLLLVVILAVQRLGRAPLRPSGRPALRAQPVHQAKPAREASRTAA